MVDTRVPVWRVQPAQQHKQDPAAGAPVGDPQQQASGQQDGQPVDGDPADLGEAGKKAIAAERARAAKAERELAAERARIKQYEDAGKSAEQKQAEQLTTLTTERDTATVKALRYEVCEAKELPLKAARFLTGSTKAEIEEAADAFKALGVANAKPATGLPPAGNLGNESKKPSGGSRGLDEAQRRFAAKSA